MAHSKGNLKSDGDETYAEAGGKRNLLLAGFFLGLLLNSANGDDIFLRNVGLLRITSLYDPKTRNIHSSTVKTSNPL
jgi:hypothetical protein